MDVDTGSMSPTEAAKKGSGLAAALGVFLIILGVLAVLEPLYAGASFTLLLALLLIGAGIVKLIWAFGAKSAGTGIITFVFGLLTMLVGLYMLARPGIAMATLTLVLAVYFFLSGISEIMYAFKLESGRGNRIVHRYRQRALGHHGLAAVAALGLVADRRAGRRQADVHRVDAGGHRGQGARGRIVHGGLNRGSSATFARQLKRSDEPR